MDATDFYGFLITQIMLTQDFFDFLEYHITKTLAKSENINKRRCWCDGIFVPENEAEYSIAIVKRTKQIVTKAWIDEGKIKNDTLGQFKYDLIIQFGEQSLQNYENETGLQKCVPSEHNDAWILLTKKAK
jgi:hypothetical protein